MKLSVYGKGGVGKSTIATHISVALAKRGKKCYKLDVIQNMIVPCVRNKLINQLAKQPEID